jgi:hypothetical protein
MVNSWRTPTIQFAEFDIVDAWHRDHDGETTSACPHRALFMLCKTVSSPLVGFCYLFIVALCLLDVALVNAQTRVPPPPALGTRGTPGPVWVPPPRRPLGTRETPVGPPAGSGQRSFPMKPKEHSVWFNLGWITAITALIAAIASLIRALRKGGWG